MHECFPIHSRMETARMKKYKVTEEGKKREVSMERSKAGVKKKKSRWPNYGRAYHPPRTRYAPKLRMNYLNNVHL